MGCFRTPHLNAKIGEIDIKCVMPDGSQHSCKGIVREDIMLSGGCTYPAVSEVTFADDMRGFVASDGFYDLDFLSEMISYAINEGKEDCGYWEDMDFYFEVVR